MWRYLWFRCADVCTARVYLLLFTIIDDDDDAFDRQVALLIAPLAIPTLAIPKADEAKDEQHEGTTDFTEGLTIVCDDERTKSLEPASP